MNQIMPITEVEMQAEEVARQVEQGELALDDSNGAPVIGLVDRYQESVTE